MDAGTPEISQFLVFRIGIGGSDIDMPHRPDRASGSGQQEDT